MFDLNNNQKILNKHFDECYMFMVMVYDYLQKSMQAANGQTKLTINNLAYEILNKTHLSLRAQKCGEKIYFTSVELSLCIIVS